MVLIEAVKGGRSQLKVEKPLIVYNADGSYTPEKHEDMSRYRTEKTDLSGNNTQAEAPQPKQAPVRAEKRVGRNDPCPCGSGKKYKNCHGQGL